MKNIMLSIRPEWLQKILSGQKTVELRLSRPNLTPPFMVFLYCSCKGTKKPGEILEIHSGGKIYKANGLVVGEFTCTEIDRVVRVGYMGSNAPLQYCVNAQPGNYTPAGKLYEDACLTVKQAEDYLCGRVGYGWHISDVQTYDRPKSLDASHLREHRRVGSTSTIFKEGFKKWQITEFVFGCPHLWYS